jgi:hypothetical protein
VFPPDPGRAPWSPVCGPGGVISFELHICPEGRDLLHIGLAGRALDVP